MEEKRGWPISGGVDCRWGRTSEQARGGRGTSPQGERRMTCLTRDDELKARAHRTDQHRVPVSDPASISIASKREGSNSVSRDGHGR